MKKITVLLSILLLFIVNTSYAVQPDKAALLKQWELHQENSVELNQFKKIDENTYFIDFKTIPFKGNITLINIDIEEIIYKTNVAVSNVGIIELKLPDELLALKTNYERSFYRWQESEFWYYDNESNNWISSKAYDKLSTTHYQTKEETKLTQLLTQYLGELLIALILLFVAFGSVTLLFLWQIKQKTFNK